MPCRHCLSAVIIEPQLRLLRTLRGLIVYPDYQAIIVHVALITKACCVVVALMVTHVLTPDTLELVLAWIVESRLEGGVNRAKLKFTKLITTTSRVSVRNIIESERESAKHIAS
jgi:hypothetical protein